jgi:PPOX class probable F420-dependent enzyme
MDLGAARSFLVDHHRAVLCTRRADGWPQMSPVACALDADGHVVVSTRQSAMKTHNVERDPVVSLCVLADAFYGEWIQLDGRAEIVRLPEAMDGLVDYYRSVSGEHPDWDDYRQAMQSERRVLLRISIERAGPDRSG